MKTLLVALFVGANLLSSAALAQSPDTLGKIKAAKAINVAYSRDSLPFSYVGPNNEPIGYSIDLCRRVITQIGRTVGDPNLKVNWLPGTVSERLQMVASGRADIECANTTQTVARLGSVDFSNLIFVDGGGFLLKTGSTINGIRDLSGKRIAVLKGTTTETRLNDTLRARLINATVVQINDGAEGLAMLEAGTIDVYAGDKIKLIGFAAQAKQPAEMAMLAEDLSFEPYAFGLPRNDSALRLEVNKALTQVYMSGEIEQIFASWLGKLGRPSGLLAAMYFLYSIPN